MRRSRYIRRPENLSHSLTIRDLEILQTISRFKYLTSSQITSLFSNSRQAINKRLKPLFHHHYLGKLPAQLSPKLFNSPDVYFININRSAARILLSKGFTLPHCIGSNRKLPKREHLQHTLLTNDILVAFELVAQSRPDFEFLSSHEMLANTPRAKHSHPWKVPAFLPGHGITRTAYPDAAFALRNKKTGKTQLYLIEADRMTQPLARNDKKLFRVSNIKGKLIIYHTAWKQGVFRERFGLPATRVLFVTLSATRARHMKSLAEEVLEANAPGLFIFTDIGDLTPDSSFWQLVFDQRI